MKKAKLDDLETLVSKYVVVQNALFDPEFLSSGEKDDLYEKRHTLQGMITNVLLDSLGYEMDYETLRLIKRK